MSPDSRSSSLDGFLFVAAMVAFAYLFLANAWVGDDGYITLRTVDNFVHGYGLRWNVHERVQVFTHPLWMLLCSAAFFLTREAFYTVIGLSFIVCASMFVAYRKALGSDEVWKAFVLIAVLTASKTFMDFSSSGLENCLSGLWAVSFVVLWIRGGGAITWPILVASAAYVTRQDTALLYIPACLSLIVHHRHDRGLVRQLVIGLSPALAWTAFSVVYFGFPFPNTAYAKALFAGVSLQQRVGQGVAYFIVTGLWDPMAALVAGIGGVLILQRRRSLWPLLIGLVLYAGYVLIVGAGSASMALRFLSVPVVIATLCCLTAISRTEGLALAGLALFVSLASPLSPWRTIGCAWADARLSESTQVLDTRAAVCRDGGALADFDRDEPLPRHTWMRQGVVFRDSPERVRLSWPAGDGYFGFAAGHRKIIVDPLGVTDPLMARLPMNVIAGRWLPGHVERSVPAGYLESLESGENRIADPSLHQYYDSLRLITAGPLFSPARWREIVAMNLGMRSHLLETYRRDRLTDPASR